MKYAVLFDPAGDGTWGAVVPDLPGCMSGGKTLDEARDSVKEAIVLWIDVARERGERIPPPASIAGNIDIA